MFAKHLAKRITPPQFLVLCYLFYALVGFLILNLSICRVKEISIIDTLITAIAAMSTAGLTTVDIGSTYSGVGQAVILFMIQLGGVGYMTFNTIVILATTNRLSHYTKKITATEFPMPKEFLTTEFVKHILIFTVLCEVFGAVFLGWGFKNAGIDHYIWYGVYHSITAFCTAGFTLFPDNLVSFKYNLGITCPISLLSILGAIGFITWLNIYKRITGEKKVLSFTAKIILFVMFWFILIGTAIFLFTERGAIQGDLWQKIQVAFFTVMNACTTAGFNSIDISSLKIPTMVFFLFLMTIGGSPSGTGGGLRSTTFVALAGLVKSTLKGEAVVSFWRREIPIKRLQLATATFAYYMGVLIVAVFILVSLEDYPFHLLAFEAVSALATSGLQTGITPLLSDWGKILICLLMLMGKVGILTFGIALTTQSKKKLTYLKDNELVL